MSREDAVALAAMVAATVVVVTSVFALAVWLGAIVEWLAS